MKRTFLTLTLLFLLGASVSAQEKVSPDKVKIDDDQTFLILSTKRIQTMEKELDEAAAKGFRVLYGAPTTAFDMAVLLNRVTGSERYNYKILATSRVKTMEKELNENARQGYRLLPRTVIFKMGLFTSELVMLMEREPKTVKSYEYKLITAGKEVKLHKKIDEAAPDGFFPMTMITLGEHVIVMEKETAVNQ